MSLCIHINTCLMPGSGCDTDGAEKCDEFIRRKKILGQNCPIIQAMGKKDSQCDLPIIRFLAGDPEICHFNGKCIRELSKVSQKLIQKYCNYANKRGEPLTLTELLQLKKQLGHVPEKILTRGGA